MSVSDVITWLVSGEEEHFSRPLSVLLFTWRDLVRETNELLDAMNDFTAVEGEIGGDGVLLLET